MDTVGQFGGNHTWQSPNVRLVDVVTDWSIGGPILWRGVWEGKEYEDKGRILDFEPGQRLVNTHLSPLAGQEDKPENYHTLTWILEGENGRTDLTLSQDNNSSAEEAQHSKGMWDALVAGAKCTSPPPKAGQPFDAQPTQR